MASRVPSHVYRNRHGTFYFRLVLPADVRHLAQCREKRFSLQTEIRSVAVARALPIIAAKWELFSELRRMAEHNDDPTERANTYNKLISALIDESSRAVTSEARAQRLQIEIEHLTARLSDTVPNAEAERLKTRLGESVPLAKAREVALNTYGLGKRKGTVSFTAEALEIALNKGQFPWSAERTAMFSELKEAYLDGLNYRGEHSARRPPSKASLSDYGPAIETFISVMGDMHIGAINRATVGQFYTVLKKLPPNINKLKKFQGKSIPEIVAMGEKPQAPSNVAKKMERISSMFGWALEEPRKWGIDSNPFSGYGLSRSAKQKTPRRPFTPEELKRLLSHPAYAQRTFERSFHFLLIPMGLFTGARLGELCQLALEDFKEIDGVWCIDLTDEAETKRLKNENAKRLIPIHPELIRMGLLRHVERLRRRGEKLLFNDDELSPNHARGKVQPASKWFGGFRKKVGLTEKQATVFHSFRHTFITRLLDDGVRAHLIAPIVGHEGELITDSVYWGVKDAVKRKATVEDFQLSDDILNLFPNVEDVTILNLPTDSMKEPTKAV